MVQRSESEASFADSQYDMVDDLSEISTDDHDTASLASNDDTGRGTPEGSDIEDEDDHEEVTFNNLQTPSSTEASFINIAAASSQNASPQVKAENALLDSYMSEDLETPRQSTMPAAFSSTYMRARSQAKITTNLEPDAATNRILLFSGRDVASEDLDFVCAKLADCMTSGNESFPGNVRPKLVRLPATPSGITLPSATVVCGDDRIAATIQHCIGAEQRSQKSYKLRILDSDGEHSSFHTTGDAKDAKINLTKPDVAVFFLDAAANDAEWLDTAYKAVQQLKVPTLIVDDDSFDLANRRSASQLLGRGSQTKRTIDHHDLIEMTKVELSDIVLGLLSRRPPQHLPLRSRVLVNRAKFSIYDMNWLKVLFAALVAVLPLLLLSLRPATSPGMALEVRREALSMAVQKAIIPSEAAKTVNVEHLLPSLTGPCATTDFFGRISPDCVPNVPFQGISPNHIIVSLPVKPRAPHLTSTSVYRADGKLVEFNQTKLIDGVYDITFNVDEAYGTIVVNMQTQRPDINITAPHYFGNRILQRQTYEKAGTDVGKAVGKDVAVMRDVAKSLTEKLTTELGATMWATKNVTTQLALYMARDLQVVGNTAVTVFDKAVKASNQTAMAITKDFVLLQRDLAKFTKDLTTTVKGGVQSAKARLRSRTELSRDRLQGIKQALERRQEGGRSIGKDLSKLSDRLRGAKKASDRETETRKESRAMKKEVKDEMKRVETVIMGAKQAAKKGAREQKKMRAAKTGVRAA